MASDNTFNYSEILASETEPNSKLFVLFILSKDKDGNDLSDQDMWATAAADMFTRIFGGATEMPPAKGKWYNEDTDEIITEAVVLVHSYARDSARGGDGVRPCFLYFGKLAESGKGVNTEWHCRE